MSSYYVYKHTTPSNKVYIGITCQATPEDRWLGGYGYGKNNHFINAINKYGWGNIKHEILHSDLTRDEANEIEIELISQHKSTDGKYGYNVSPGGGAHSKETRNKMAEILKAKFNEPGQKIKQRERALKRWTSPSYRENQSKAQTEAQGSEEVRKQRSDTAKERWANPEFHSKQCESRAAAIVSDETRKLLSDLKKEQLSSPEARESLSKRTKKQWENQETRTKMVEAISKACNTPENKERRSQLSKDMWKNKGHSLKKYGHPREVRCVDTGKVYESAREASELTPSGYQGILLCCKKTRNRQTCAGLRWEWAEVE